jgi:predicted alpha/beta-fold hydrolase
VLDSIAVPTLIITAQDDPFIPYSMFTVPLIQRHPKIRVIAPRHGGHCGFFHWAPNGEDPYWAENRIVDFLLQEHGERIQIEAAKCKEASNRFLG